jgi:hypothetical protein
MLKKPTPHSVHGNSRTATSSKIGSVPAKKLYEVPKTNIRREPGTSVNKRKVK